MDTEKYCVQSHALVLIEKPFCLVPTEKQNVQSHANVPTVILEGQSETAVFGSKS